MVAALCAVCVPRNYRPDSYKVVVVQSTELTISEVLFGEARDGSCDLICLSERTRYSNSAGDAANPMRAAFSVQSRTKSGAKKSLQRYRWRHLLLTTVWTDFETGS